MATFNSMLSAAVSIAQAVSVADTAGVVTVVLPADSVRNTIAVYGLLITAQAAPSATVAALFKQGTTTVLTIELPAATLFPFWMPFPANHPYIAPAGSTVSLTVPGLGGTTVSTAAIFYAYVTV